MIFEKGSCYWLNIQKHNRYWDLDFLSFQFTFIESLCIMPDKEHQDLLCVGKWPNFIKRNAKQ